MKIRIEGFIGAYHWGNPKAVLEDFTFTNYDPTSENRVMLQPHSFEVDITVPNDEQLTAQIVAALREEKNRLFTEAAEKAAVYDDKIQQLLALTNEAKSTEVFDDIPF